MGLGYKYHIVTIVAIFFALAVGLVVGSLFLAAPVAERQTRAIHDLSVRLDNLRDEERRTDDQLRRYRDYAAQTLPLVLKSHLAHVRVALVQTGDYADATAAAQDALQMAGADVASVTIIDHPFAMADDALQARLNDTRAATPGFPGNRTALCDALAGVFAHGDSPAVGTMDALAQNGFLHADGQADYTAPVRFVVLVAGSRSDATDHVTNVDQPLLTALQTRGLEIAACEPSDAAVSDMATYRTLNLRVTTVDDIDTEVGRCALVFALGNEPGEYGLKPSDQLLPAVKP